MEYRLLPNTESVLDAIAREDTIEYSATPGDSGWMRMEPLWPDDQIELWFTMGNSYRFRAQGGGNERS